MPADIDETTYNLNWLRYGPQQQLVVHWVDERPPAVFSFDALVELTKRTALSADARRIRFVEVFSPNDILRQVEIIDTPGLASSHGADSAKTEALLRLCDETTVYEASEADAIILVFQRSIHEADQTVLERFQGALLGRAID